MEVHVRIGFAKDPVTLKDPFAEGGEARVYKLANDTAVKIYRGPNDSEYDFDPDGLRAARIRLMAAQSKLLIFPSDLPPGIIAPRELVREPGSGLIIGYTMPLIKGARPLMEFKSRDVRATGVTDQQVLRIFRHLRATVKAAHQRGIVLGDFNANNVLVRGEEAHVIDADSMQFAHFRSKVFMQEYVDPNRCAATDKKDLELIHLHNEASDWYAWWTMLFQSLCFIHPYGGVHKPADKTKAIPPGLRGLPQHRLSVYHPEVNYPKQARPLDELPEILERYFKMVFVEGLRPEPPESLFASLGYRHDGSFDKTAIVQAPVPTATRSSKTVQAHNLRTTQGTLLAASLIDGTPHVADYYRRALRRNESDGLPLPQTEGVRFWIGGPQMGFGVKNGSVITHPRWKDKLRASPKVSPTAFGPLIAGTAHGTVYWDGAFKLVRGNTEPVIQLLDIDQALEPLGFWSEEDFLFILSTRNGQLGYAVHHLGWDRTLVQTAHPFAAPGDIVNAHGYGNADGAWLFLEQRDGRKTCAAFDKTGQLLNHFAYEAANSPEWMRRFDGKCLTKVGLFSGAAAGITRLALKDNALELTHFASPRPLDGVDLLASDTGLIAVDRAANEILRLTVG